MISAGCRWFTLKDAFQHWTLTHPNPEIIQRLKVLKVFVEAWEDEEGG